MTGVQTCALPICGGVIQMVDPASDVTDVFKKYPIVKNYGHVDYACYKVTK